MVLQASVSPRVRGNGFASSCNSLPSLSLFDLSREAFTHGEDRYIGSGQVRLRPTRFLRCFLRPGSRRVEMKCRRIFDLQVLLVRGESCHRKRPAQAQENREVDEKIPLSGHIPVLSRERRGLSRSSPEGSLNFPPACSKDRSKGARHDSFADFRSRRFASLRAISFASRRPCVLYFIN